MWTWLRTIFRTAKKLDELEQRFIEIQTEWRDVIDALRRREERERKRGARALRSSYVADSETNATDAEQADSGTDAERDAGATGNPDKQRLRAIAGRAHLARNRGGLG